MSHDTHTLDGINKDLIHGCTTLQAQDHYLNLASNWTDPFSEPQVICHEGFNVVREDLLEVGSKARFGDLLIRSSNSNTIVYCQPRFGFAGISLSYLCKRYGKKLVLFMPSSKEVSEHQRYCIEQGAIPIFRRIAAMPNLSLMAKEWANNNQAEFIPLGLKHPLVTACAVKVAYNLSLKYGQPHGFWCAISTGVLSRALQIAWPTANCVSVAVARNLKAGELGRSRVVSHPLPFEQNASKRPPFPSASNYDAKVWEYMKIYGVLGEFFWNVAGNISPKTDELIDSYRNWGEIR